MQDQQPQADTAREIRRLDQQADHLEFLGQYEESAILRRSASALAEAEGQRLAALIDARTRVSRLTQRLDDLWHSIEPRDSFAWFLAHSDDQEVMALREALERQQARILIVDAARA